MPNYSDQFEGIVGAGVVVEDLKVDGGYDCSQVHAHGVPVAG